jgi:hypothetical protein
MDLHVSWFTVSMRHGQVTLLILQEGDPAGDLLVLMALGVLGRFILQTAFKSF